MKRTGKTIGMTLAALFVATLALCGTASADHRDDDQHSGLELLCYEAYQDDDFDFREHRGEIRVEVEEQGGRLIASVYEEDFGRGDRLVKRAGVAKRDGAGRGYDVIYIGRELKVSVDTYTGDALLELGSAGRTSRVPLSCY